MVSFRVRTLIMSSPIALSDIVCLPTRVEYGLTEHASRLFAMHVRLHSYHARSEERIDVWLRREEPGMEIFGLGNEEAVSVFRHKKREDGEIVFGPWLQIINLGYEHFTSTVVHELAHLVDRYHKAPRLSWTSADKEFEDLYAAYSKTQSSYLLQKLKAGKFPTAIDPQGNEHDIFDEVSRKLLPTLAREMLKGHEVFARCLTAYIFYRSNRIKLTAKKQHLCDLFLKRVDSLRNRSIGADLNLSDFLIIETSMQQLLNNLGWSSESID